MYQHKNHRYRDSDRHAAIYVIRSGWGAWQAKRFAPTHAPVTGENCYGPIDTWSKAMKLIEQLQKGQAV